MEFSRRNAGWSSSHPGRLDLLVASGGTVLWFEGRDPAKSGPIFLQPSGRKISRRGLESLAR